MTSQSKLSRRSLLKQAAVAGSAALVSNSPLGAQTNAPASRDLGPNVAGRKFMAVVSAGFGANTTKVMELTLLPISDRQVVVRTEASQCCYTMCARVLGTQDPPDPLGPQAPVIVNDPNEPTIQGHGGVGTVIAVGASVKRVQVGDRVIVPVTAQCGQCYQCLRGRADRCQFAVGAKTVAIATMANGAKVVQAGNIGGLAEYMVPFEEATVPVFTTVPSNELAMLHCVSGCGLGMTMTLSPIEPGSNVAVYGLGPVGLSAVQGARIMGADHVIGVDPVKVRRDLALKLGATEVLDPNVYKGWDLVAKIKSICKGTDRIYAGGSFQTPNRAGIAANIGPDYVIEAVGFDRYVPRVEAGPDPTGMEVLGQVWQTVPTGGHVCTCGVGHPPQAKVSFPVAQWANGSKTHHSSQYGGTNSMREIPRFVRLIERGQFDAKAMITATYKLDQIMDAYNAVAYRTTVTAMVTMA
jgi:S-(hydroxymethyl)glutathione dehydrogenase / alcohol dehydrogenase